MTRGDLAHTQISQPSWRRFRRGVQSISVKSPSPSRDPSRSCARPRAPSGADTVRKPIAARYRATMHKYLARVFSLGTLIPIAALGQWSCVSHYFWLAPRRRNARIASISTTDRALLLETDSACVRSPTKDTRVCVKRCSNELRAAIGLIKIVEMVAGLYGFVMNQRCIDILCDIFFH